MSALGSKLRHASHEGVHIVAWFCPGCDHAHNIRVQTGGIASPAWSVRGTPEAPIFSPSVLVYHMALKPGKHPEFPQGRPQQTICHCFVGGASGQCPGFIDFLSDCAHALRGQHAMPAWPRNYGFGGA